MRNPEPIQVPSKLIVTAIFSSCLSGIVAVTYIILCIIALVFRSKCDYLNLETIPGSGYLKAIIYRAYILSDECENYLQVSDITPSYTIFLLTIFTLVSSLLVLGMSIAVTIVISKEQLKYINLVTYLYFAAQITSLVVDLTFAVYFGMDYGVLGKQLDMSSAGLSMNYLTDSLRLGASFMMTVALKGFIYPIINIVFSILMVLNATEYSSLLLKQEHSIHKIGMLNGYEQQRRPAEDAWNPQPDFLGLARKPYVNPAYVTDDELSPPPRSPMREVSYSDYSNRFFDRSESWQGKSPSTTSSRPFSYLAEPSRSVSVAPRPPPVPAPDYSPPTGRRLKPALKSAYM